MLLEFEATAGVKGSHNILHNIGMVALAQHADLSLDVSNLVALSQLDDFDGNKFPSGFQDRLVN